MMQLPASLYVLLAGHDATALAGSAQQDGTLRTIKLKDDAEGVHGMLTVSAPGPWLLGE